MEEKELIEILKKHFPQGTISCTDAHRLAEKLGVSNNALGKACHEAKIKIIACELGCF